MKNIHNLQEQLNAVLKYPKTHSSKDIATMLHYHHHNMVRVIKNIVGGRKLEFEYLLSSEEVIRLIFALPEYNSSLVNYAKSYLAHQLCELAKGTK